MDVPPDGDNKKLGKTGLNLLTILLAGCVILSSDIEGVVHYRFFCVVLVVITRQDSEDTLDLQPDSTHVNGARLLLHIFCAIKVPLF